ncbi:MAG TPA: hypothetical protein VIO11_03445 [Candidatus Methanoperedens sp.]
MTEIKMVFLGVLGALFMVSGLNFHNISYGYLGLGTWLAGLVYFTFFRNYKEIISIILGLLILHAGVILIIGDTSHRQLLGLLVFTGGIIVVLNSGFSDYMKKRKNK